MLNPIVVVMMAEAWAHLPNFHEYDQACRIRANWVLATFYALYEVLAIIFGAAGKPSSMGEKDGKPAFSLTPRFIEVNCGERVSH